MKGDSELNQLLDELEHITNTVIDNLLNMDEEDFEQFVSKRQNIVEQLEPYRSIMNDTDKQKIRAIIDHDPEILEQMHALKQEAGNWMEKRESIRVQQNAYQHAYTYDSLFIDHKK
ncbi:hypothetical protein SAMN05661091_0351 [Paenibacillus uliginis N3/975]|uniref:Flagellar protein FliT n=1 Tax=Paenibacillus uliginis N3/975 TaxID=1313296 RepID=A0A1X7GCH2_9BACL|nr:hypothetical protein [Paenibacillus uliginis]SMF67489.1 hypothetical protein SAMN05661091_0351 [Paenibacillus uliginis N3/975]